MERVQDCIHHLEESREMIDALGQNLSRHEEFSKVSDLITEALIKLDELLSTDKTKTV